MARTARRLLTVALLGGVLALPAAHAQAQTQAPPPGSAATAPAPAPATAPGVRRDFGELYDALPEPLPAAGLALGGAWEPEFLKTLPHPPDEPYSMLGPPPPVGAPPPNLEKYFEVDPILEAPEWPQPGWYNNVQIGVIHPQLYFAQMRHGVALPNGNRAFVSPGNATLGWAIAPRIELGYRLPSGFGAFSVSDRFFNAYGTGTFVNQGPVSSQPVGTTTRTSRLGVNYWDFDYSSREYTAWKNWSMDWRFGVRTAFTWVGNLVDKPFAYTAAGKAFIAGDSNYTVGNGPHVGVGLNRRFAESGFSFVTKVDLANEFTKIRQLYGATTTTVNGAGEPERGHFTTNFWNNNPILNFQVGLGWQPPSNPNIQLYVGYLYEFWWQVASNSNFTINAGGPRGAFDNQGIVFQGSVKW